VIPAAERGDLVTAFYKRLTSRSRAMQLKAAKAWAVWEAATSYLRVSEANIANWNTDDFAIAVARIECHYFVHQGFFETEDQLLRNVRRIRHIPAVIVQGRYDVVCPMRSAWDLHRAWPEAELRVVPDAGHSALEPGNTHELVSATDRFAG
jgi:proline iminopeptidase